MGVLPRLLEDFIPSPRKSPRALQAVASTISIIRLSEYLVSMNGSNSSNNLIILSLIAFLQWAILDQTPASLITGIVTSIGGPVAELPFIANGCWHYLPEAADYVPFSSITGPCYFAVCMDSIALGRWFDTQMKS